MQERLLHTVWQYSLYTTTNMKTVDGDDVVVIHPGRYNTDAGPDFLEAKIKIGNATLVGHVEMHVHSRDWSKHGHQHDDAYKNVILHVVYDYNEHDKLDNIPTVCIAPYVSDGTLQHYEYLMYSKESLPCSGKLDKVKDITKYSWLTRLLAERWEDKLGNWQDVLNESAGDWSNLLYYRLAANFGFKVNTDAFLELAKSLPLKVLAKHKDNLNQVEALLFGQAGMLDASIDDAYFQSLADEYKFLKQKYELTPIDANLWKFMRMRPANFPTIRIAQFAALIHKSVHLFANIIEKSTVKDIQPLFDVTASEYWNKHYLFGELADKEQKKRLGKSSVQNLIINTVAPIKFLYASQQGTEIQQEEALKLLDELPAEKNRIIAIWQEHKWAPENASQSQAQIQLYNNYCTNKKCLDCAIGLSIVKS